MFVPGRLGARKPTVERFHNPTPSTSLQQAFGPGAVWEFPLGLSGCRRSLWDSQEIIRRHS
jgi:hypothetical protein